MCVRVHLCMSLCMCVYVCACAHARVCVRVLGSTLSNLSVSFPFLLPLLLLLLLLLPLLFYRRLVVVGLLSGLLVLESVNAVFRNLRYWMILILNLIATFIEDKF